MSAMILLAGCGGLTGPSNTPSTFTFSSPETTAPPPTATATDTPTTHTTTTSDDNSTTMIGATHPPSVECTITGTDGNDNIHMDPDAPGALYGTPGDDIICAGDGKDAIFAGKGNDIIYGGSGRDIIFGGTYEIAPRSHHSGPDNDIIYGGPDLDVIHGHQGNDILYGHHGRDSIEGGRGNDVLFPGFDPFEVLIKGGNGSDVAVMINGQVNGWVAGSEPAGIPLEIPNMPLPIGVSIPLNSTDPKDMVSASVLKDYVGITTSGDVCICDPNDKTV